MKKFEALPAQPTRDQVEDALLSLPPRLVKKIALLQGIQVSGRFRRQQRVRELLKMQLPEVARCYNLTIENREHKVEKTLQFIKALPGFLTVVAGLIAKGKQIKTVEDGKELIEDLADAFEDVDV